MRARIASMIRKEFIQILRDRRTLAMIIAIPAIWLIAFGYAVSFDVKHVATAVLDRAGTPAAHGLIAGLRVSDSFRLQTLDVHDEAGLRRAIDNGEIAAALLIPPGFGVPGSGAQARLLIDGSQLFAAQSVLREAQRLAVSGASGASPGLAGMSAGAAPAAPGAPNVTILYNPDLKSSYVMIPGLIGLVLAFIATIMTALGIARERERGTLEQLIVTPVRPIELMLGKVLPYVLIAALDFLVVVALGLLVFTVPLRGPFLVLAAASLFFLLGALGLGLLVSTVSQNQQQAMQLAIFTVLPQFIFSGFIFPLEAIPWGVRWIGYLAPLTYFVPVARGVFLKASDLSVLWPNLAILAAYGAAVLGLAAARFRKRLA